MKTTTNKEKEKNIVITESDLSENDKNINIYIEDLLKEWNGPIYGSIKWDNKKQKWVKSIF